MKHTLLSFLEWKFLVCEFQCTILKYMDRTTMTSRYAKIKWIECFGYNFKAGRSFRMRGSNERKFCKASNQYTSNVELCKILRVCICTLHVNPMWEWANKQCPHLQMCASLIPRNYDHWVLLDVLNFELAQAASMITSVAASPWRADMPFWKFSR